MNNRLLMKTIARAATAARGQARRDAPSQGASGGVVEIGRDSNDPAAMNRSS